MDRKKLIYIGSLLIITVIISITYFSYAFFTNKSEQHGKINVVAGTLNYDVKGEGITNKSITIPANTTKKIELTLKSLNDINSKYELYYTTTSNDIEVGYSSDTEDDITGTIVANGKKKITVFVTNPTSSPITVTFNAEGGFSGNNLTRTLGKIIPSQESICENYETHVFNFDYNGTDGTDGSVQEFVAPCDGDYTIETWGAQGGSIDNTYLGGYGGYSVGSLPLDETDNLFINVGGEGSNSINNQETPTGGYNGGGASGINNSACQVHKSASGGGATSIALVEGLLSELSEKKDKIIITSGGGGGSFNCNSSNLGSGGHAGGYSGNVSTILGKDSIVNGGYSVGGNQTTFGCSTKANGACGAFGLGGTPIAASTSLIHGAGGGAGYYGGSGNNASGGAGGSGYIGSPNLTNKAMYCYDCEETTEVDTYTISTTNSSYMENSSSCPDGYSSNPISKCAKAGNGYARITYYGKDTTKVTYDYNYLPNDMFAQQYIDNNFYYCCNNTNGHITSSGIDIDSNGKTYYVTGTNGFYFGSSTYLPKNAQYSFRFEGKANLNFNVSIGSEQTSYLPYNITTSYQRYTNTFKVLRDESYRAFVFYNWWNGDEERELYIRNLQMQPGNPYTIDVNYTKNSTLSNITTPRRSGWTFNGWYTDPIGGTQVTSSTSVPNSDTTYYAHWTSASPVVTSTTTGDTMTADGRTYTRTSSDKVLIGMCNNYPSGDWWGYCMFAASQEALTGTNNEYGSVNSHSLTTPKGNTVYYVRQASAWPGTEGVINVVSGGKKFTVKSFVDVNNNDFLKYLDDALF